MYIFRGYATVQANRCAVGTDLLPLVVLALLPDDYSVVEGARSEYGAIFGVSPGDLPDRAFVSAEIS